MLTDAPLRVLVAGSDPLARRGLSQALSDHAELEVLGPVGLSGGLMGSLTQAIALHRPDAVVVDAGPLAGPLPEGLNSVAGVPILVLSPDADHAARALADGAQGAIFRDGDPARISAALTALDQGLMVVDAAFAEAFRRALPQHHAPSDDDFALTARELEVLALLAEGLSNKEIAAQLGFSAHTAKFHVNAVLDKLGAASRTEAVTRAARAGLLRL